MNVIGYTRVSTQSQVDGDSLAAQASKIEDYCCTHGHTLIKIFSDEGVSSKKLTRPGLTQAVNLLSKDLANTIIVTSLCRLSRESEVTNLLLDNVFNTTTGFKLLVIEQNEKYSLQDTIDFNDRTLAVISTRTREVLQHMKKEGKRVGQIPYGKRLADDGVHLIDDPDELNTIAIAQDLREKGLSYRKISYELLLQGKLTRAGKPFSAMTLRRLCQVL